MTFVRSILIAAAGALVAALGISAQQPPAPTPSSASMTTTRTWADDDLDKIMKQIGAARGVLQKAVDGKNTAEAEATAARLQVLFNEVEQFFDARKMGEPEDWADDAADHAEHVEDSVEAQDFARAAEHLKLLASSCQTCHTKYRDKSPDGGFVMKKQ